MPPISIGVVEPCLELLADGRLLLLVRLNGPQLWQAYSSTGGRTWSTLAPARAADGGAPPGAVWPQLLRLSNNALVVASGRYLQLATLLGQSGGIGLWVSPDGTGESWYQHDVIAEHNAHVLLSERFTNHSGTTGYTGLVEVEPGVLLLAYDRLEAGTARSVPNRGDFGQVYTMRVTVQSLKPRPLKSDDGHSAAIPSAAQLQLMDVGLATFMHFSVDTFSSATAPIEHNCADGHGNPPQCMPASAFNPTHLDTDQWVRAAVQMGAGEICLTAHHEGGFCLWDTKFSNYSSMHSPFGKDVVAMFIASCRKFNVRPCFYFGPNSNGWLTNNRSYSPSQFIDAQLGMLGELLTNYGSNVVSRLWWDHYATYNPSWGGCAANCSAPGNPDCRPPAGYFSKANGGANCPNGSFPAAWPRFVALVRKLSPSTIICPGPDCDGHQGEGGTGRYPSFYDCDLDGGTWAQSEPTLQLCNARSGHEANGTMKVFHPFETCETMRTAHSWFCQGDCNQKAEFWTARDIWDHYFASVSVGWINTLNAPPAATGLIPTELVQSMTDFGDALRALLKPVTESAAIYNVTLECGPSAAPVTLDMGKPVAFNAVMSRENLSDGQRVRSYRVEHQLVESDPWNAFALGGADIGYGPPLTPVGRCTHVPGVTIIPGGASGNTQCIGLTPTAEACADKCLADANCHFYTWHDNTTGLFAHKCFFRFDDCFSGRAQAGHFSGVCNSTGANGSVPARSSCPGTPSFGVGIHGESIGARMIDFVPETTARKVRITCTRSVAGSGSSAQLKSFSVHSGQPPVDPDPSLGTAGAALRSLKADDGRAPLAVPPHIKIMTAYGYDAPMQAGWCSFGKSFNLSALVEGHRVHRLPGMWRIDCIGCQHVAKKWPGFASGIICEAKLNGLKVKRLCSKAKGDTTDWDAQTRHLLAMARPHLISGVLVGIFLGDEITGHGPGGRADIAEMFADFEAWVDLVRGLLDELTPARLAAGHEAPMLYYTEADVVALWPHIPRNLTLFSMDDCQ